MAPLSRAYQFGFGDTYDGHPGDGPRTAPCGSDDLLGPTDDIMVAHEAWGVDFGAGLAVVTGGVPVGATPDDAHQQIRLLMLVNEISLRNMMSSELAKGFGFLQSRPATVFSPVAVTPDELGGAWRDAKVHLPLRASWNGGLVGQPDAGADMVVNFAQLIAHLARTRNVRAGSIVAAQRSREASAPTPPRFMRSGDVIRVEVLDEMGKSVFG